MNKTHLILGVAATMLLATSAAVIAAVPAPLWEFKFDDVASGVQAINTGSDPNAANAFLTMLTKNTNVPTARRLPGGPSGLASDYCWGGGVTYFAQVPGSQVGGISNLNQVTCTGWYKSTSPVPITPQYNRVFLWGNRHNWDQGMVVDFNPQDRGYNQLGFEVNDYYNRDNDGGGDGYAGPVVNDVNVWHFWAITYDGTQTSNNVKIYMGDTAASVSLIGTASITYVPLTGPPINNPTGIIRNAGGNFNLAWNEDWNNNNGFTGYQDDIRIFNGVMAVADMETVRQGDLVPEPGTLSLLVVAGMALLRRRK